MKSGRQYRFCPNCGKPLFDERITVGHVTSLMCSDRCRDEWKIKYSQMLLGQDGPPARRRI
jgi:hypothetical protein